MNVPYEVQTKCCYFVANPISKMAASGRTWFNIGPYGKCIQMTSIKGTTEWNEIKHSLNVPDEMLTKCCYFVANPSSKMAASGGLSLT